MNMPHNVAPAPETIRCVIAYKHYNPVQETSHIGLGISSMAASKLLRAAGIFCEVWAVLDAADLGKRIDQATGVPVSHVVICAPWLPTPQLARLISMHTGVDFVLVSHSNVAFLQADPDGARLMLEAIGLQHQWHNFKVGANSRKFSEWLRRAYGAHPLWLPNLYFLPPDMHPARPQWKSGGPLRIGSFGAVRMLKNHIASAAAAIEISRRLGADVEFWMNDACEGAALKAIQQFVAAAPQVHLKFLPWSDWHSFTNTIRRMHLLLQPSFTESFNLVCADGIAQGVPSVVSSAIDWCPDNWVANSDDACDIANVGVALLADPEAASEGLRALRQHNRVGLLAWNDFLLGR